MTLTYAYDYLIRVYDTNNKCLKETWLYDFTDDNAAYCEAARWVEYNYRGRDWTISKC
jgi:transketolase